MITSARNQHVALCRSLHNARKRRESGLYLIEGVRVAHEALSAGAHIEFALYDPDALAGTDQRQALLDRVLALDSAFEASAAVIEAAGETKSPQGVIMVAREPAAPPIAMLQGRHLLLILDGITDGGNAGTILRSAAGAGVKAVVFTGSHVDPWLGKVVRAGMGAHFRLAIAQLDWPALLPVVDSYRQVVAADARGESSIYDLTWSPLTAIIIGSEARGLSPETAALDVTRARIPLAAGVESLNAASAASIILFQAAGPL